ncbi:hypothetical protein BGZ63DRAFT_402102 [Mariannaea sp. PMI_226]|nr:hypothetical protein BGZ63DRAFT_402102 [Mariannaea sp. PMI_226]
MPTPTLFPSIKDVIEGAISPSLSRETTCISNINSNAEDSADDSDDSLPPAHKLIISRTRSGCIRYPARGSLGRCVTQLDFDDGHCQSDGTPTRSSPCLDAVPKTAHVYPSHLTKRQLSPETLQSQDLETTICVSSVAEARASVAVSGLSSGINEAPRSTKVLTKSNPHHQAESTSVHYREDNDNDADSDSQVSQDDLDRTNLVHDDNSHPSLLTEGKRHHGSENDDERPRKRYKILGKSKCLTRQKTTKAQRPHRGTSKTYTAESIQNRKRYS